MRLNADLRVHPARRSAFSGLQKSVIPFTLREQRFGRVIGLLAVLLVGCCAALPGVKAQEPAASPSGSEQKPRDAKTLSDEQMAVSGRFARFERMLMQMADVLGRQDPERADLLRRAISKGREELVREDIEQIIKLLDQGELGAATEKQAEVLASFQNLMKLLQSEDRRSAVERERDRLNGLLKDVRGVIAEQRSARATTQNSATPSNAAPGQQRSSDETQKLLDQMKEHDSEEAGKNADEGEKTPPKSADDPKTPSGEQNPKDSGEPEPGKDGSGKSEPKEDTNKSRSGDSGSKDGKESGSRTPQTPGRKELESAQQQMQDALKQLQQQERKDALEHQDKALEDLHAAADELEEKLKQLREEEKEMVLASLEARFQRMLAEQTQIHEGTIALASTPQKDWLELSFARCRELAQQQTELGRECSQTVGLLREDGSAVAILLAVEDIEADMKSIADWMQDNNVGDLTQSVQKDVIDSLKQLIETTQKEMQEMKDKDRQQQQQQSSREQSALVELMAEIRVLRSLQLQVNRRTKQIDELLASAPNEDQSQLQKQISELARRQQRLIETARELARQMQD